MTYTKKLLLAVLFFPTYSLFAQQPPAISSEGGSIRVLTFNTGSKTESKVDGSPYYQEEFLKAYISSLDTIMDVRYNVANDEMEVKYNGNVGQLIKSDSLYIKFQYTNKTYKYLFYSYKDEIERGYLIPATSNNIINLFIKENIKLIPFSEGTLSYGQKTEGRPAYYKKDDSIYLIEYSNSIKEMPSKKKELLKMFPNKEKEIETFLKSNKTSFKEEKDLILLVNYLDTLN